MRLKITRFRAGHFVDLDALVTNSGHSILEARVHFHESSNNGPYRTRAYTENEPCHKVGEHLTE
jgi:hypothetical protein